MKKFIVMLSLIAIMVGLMPISAKADTYYDVSPEQSEWIAKDGGGYYINKKFSVSKTIGGFVYITMIETNNVEITGEMVGTNFELVNKEETANGVAYLLKLKDGVTLSGSTEAITVVANIVDPDKKECELDYSPQGLSCVEFGGNYFDKDGNNVSAQEYEASCNGTPTTPTNPSDVPNTPDTGSVIPYIAIGGGLVAILGVYLYTRKSNKVYKI